MPKEINLPLPTADNLFSTQDERDAEQKKWIEDLPIELIDDHPDHPYGIRMDADMIGTMESVKEHGVLVHALVRPKEDGRYEMLAGYRRKFISLEVGHTSLPCIIDKMTDDEATIVMVDSNAQRSIILPSEKAKAYALKLPAMDRQGQRTDLTSSVLPTKFEKGVRTADLVGAPYGDGGDAVYQYIKLNKLIPEILQMVDNKKLKLKNTLKMGLYPAEQLAELSKEAQRWVLDAMLMEDRTPSHAQTIRMVEDFKASKLTKDDVIAIMQEEKPNQKERFTIPREKISRFFKPDTPAEKIMDTIVQALEHLQRSRTRPQRSGNDRGDDGAR